MVTETQMIKKIMKWENVEYTVHWKKQEIYAMLEVYNKEMYPLWPAASQPLDTICPIKPINLPITINETPVANTNFRITNWPNIQIFPSEMVKQEWLEFQGIGERSEPRKWCEVEAWHKRNYVGKRWLRTFCMWKEGDAWLINEGNVKRFSKIRVTDTSAKNFIVTMYTWHIDSRWNTSDTCSHHWHFKHLSHCTKAHILV